MRLSNIINLYKLDTIYYLSRNLDTNKLVISQYIEEDKLAHYDANTLHPLEDHTHSIPLQTQKLLNNILKERFK